MLLQLLQYLSNGLYMLFTFAFDVDKDIIKIHYYKNVKFLYQDLVDVAQECGQYIGESKRHHLILEIAIAAPKGRFLFIAFLDSHLMVSIGEIELGETSSST